MEPVNRRLSVISAKRGSHLSECPPRSEGESGRKTLDLDIHGSQPGTSSLSVAVFDWVGGRRDMSVAIKIQGLGPGKWNLSRAASSHLALLFVKIV